MLISVPQSTYGARTCTNTGDGRAGQRSDMAQCKIKPDATEMMRSSRVDVELIAISSLAAAGFDPPQSSDTLSSILMRMA
jgi:hypothetical protein